MTDPDLTERARVVFAVASVLRDAADRWISSGRATRGSVPATLGAIAHILADAARGDADSEAPSWMVDIGREVVRLLAEDTLMPAGVPPMGWVGRWPPACSRRARP